MKSICRALHALLLLALLCSGASAQFVDQRNYGGTSGGSANAQTITIANMPSTVPAGVPYRFLPGFANTSAATLTISGGSSATALCKPSPAGPVALTGGELQTTQVAEIVSNGTCYVITSSVDSTVSSLVSPPQGRLTLTSGVPVLSADVVAATTAYYTPYVGNQAPIYNGSKMVMFTFSELTLTIPSSRLANLLYDVFVFSNSGAATVCTGPAWSNSVAGSGSRGTGAGTTQISVVAGFLVNTVSISCVNGGTTYTIAASQGTYVGTFYMDGTNGQVSALFGFGQSRKIGVWNYYNRVPAMLRVGDATASWSYNTAAYRASNNSSANKGTVLQGVAEDFVDVRYNSGALGNFSFTFAGIGVNSTTVSCQQGLGWSVNGSTKANLTATCIQAPALGLTDFTALEKGDGAASTTWFGTEVNMQLVPRWRY